jgi:hypothetical protein
MSCKPAEEQPTAYIEHIRKEPALNKTVVVGEIRYTFHFLTPEAVSLQYSLNVDGSFDAQRYKKRFEELKDNIYINIDHRLNNSEEPVLKYQLTGPGQYEQRVMYYEFEAKRDMKAICNGVELNSVNYLYENHLGLSPYNTIMVGFPKCEGSSDLQILFSDRAFNNLFIKVNFNKEDIDQLPRLVLN